MLGQVTRFFYYYFASVESYPSFLSSDYSLTVPLPMPKIVYSMRYLLFGYFAFAIFYDILTIVIGHYVEYL